MTEGEGRPQSSVGLGCVTSSLQQKVRRWLDSRIPFTHLSSWPTTFTSLHNAPTFLPTPALLSYEQGRDKQNKVCDRAFSRRFSSPTLPFPPPPGLFCFSLTFSYGRRSGKRGDDRPESEEKEVAAEEGAGVLTHQRSG